MLFCTKRNLGLLKKWLEQGKYKVCLEHLVGPKSKEMLKE